LGVSTFSLSSTVQAETIFVKADAGGTVHNGEGWGTAYKDLQTALDAAQPADPPTEVWVAAGEYYPTVERTMNDCRSVSFKMKDGVLIYGGFDGTESVLTDRNPDVNTNITTLSGDLADRDDRRCGRCETSEK